ncbi:MAG: CBS domain-containing protein [Candidatus Aenigmatarchaeota archaeon]
MELRDLKGATMRVRAIAKDSTIRQLLDFMARQNADILPVVGESSLVGVVTERDLLKLVRAQPVAGVSAVLVNDFPKHIDGRYVSEIMTRSPMATGLGSDVEDLIKRMAANGVRSVIVVDNGKILGVARARDILRGYYSFR